MTKHTPTRPTGDTKTAIKTIVEKGPKGAIPAVDLAPEELKARIGVLKTLQQSPATNPESAIKTQVITSTLRRKTLDGGKNPYETKEEKTKQAMIHLKREGFIAEGPLPKKDPSRISMMDKSYYITEAGLEHLKQLEAQAAQAGQRAGVSRS